MITLYRRTLSSERVISFIAVFGVRGKSFKFSDILKFFNSRSFLLNLLIVCNDWIASFSLPTLNYHFGDSGNTNTTKSTIMLRNSAALNAGT